VSSLISRSRNWRLNTSPSAPSSEPSSAAETTLPQETVTYFENQYKQLLEQKNKKKQKKKQQQQQQQSQASHSTSSLCTKPEYISGFIWITGGHRKAPCASQPASRPILDDRDLQRTPCLQLPESQDDSANQVARSTSNKSKHRPSLQHSAESLSKSDDRSTREATKIAKPATRGRISSSQGHSKVVGRRTESSSTSSLSSLSSSSSSSSGSSADGSLVSSPTLRANTLKADSEPMVLLHSDDDSSDDDSSDDDSSDYDDSSDDDVHSSRSTASNKTSKSCSQFVRSQLATTTDEQDIIECWGLVQPMRNRISLWPQAPLFSAPVTSYSSRFNYPLFASSTTPPPCPVLPPPSRVEWNSASEPSTRPSSPPIQLSLPETTKAQLEAFSVVAGDGLVC
jgi:hypothetical protein